MELKLNINAEQNNFIMLQMGDTPEYQPPTITQKLLPMYRKVSGIKKPTPETSIPQDHQSIISKIDKLTEFFEGRMTVHEHELLNVMKLQIKRILQNLGLMMMNYNKMINQKNLSQDLWETRNEVEYFKFQSLRLYKQNSMMKKQLEKYQEQFRKYEFDNQCKDQALKKMAHKLAKSKAKNKINLDNSRRHNSVVFDTLEKSHRTQQQTEPDYNAINHKLDSINLLKINKKYSANPKLNMKTQGDQKILNPEIKPQVNMPFLPGRQDRIKLLKQKLSFSNKGRI